MTAVKLNQSKNGYIAYGTSEGIVRVENITKLMVRCVCVWGGGGREEGREEGRERGREGGRKGGREGRKKEGEKGGRKVKGKSL